MKTSSTTISYGLRTDVLEQVMRLTDDDVLVLPFLDADPGSRRAATALGRLLASSPFALRAGTPLVAFLTGADVDTDWREQLIGPETSLWSSFEMLETLYPQACACGDCGDCAVGDNPFLALEAARARAASVDAQF